MANAFGLKVFLRMVFGGQMWRLMLLLIATTSRGLLFG